MKEKLMLSNEVITINNYSVKKIYGGFGDGQPCILAKQVAELHGYEVREINQLVNNNLDWFDEGIDIIDLKKVISSGDNLGIIQNDSQYITDIKKFLFNFYSQDALNASKHIYIFSQQGYALLCKLLKSDLAKKIYKQMVRNYFGIKAKIIYEGYTDNVTQQTHISSLFRMAEDDAALERMFRKRKKILREMGLSEKEAILKAIESIKYATGIDMTERVQYNPFESKDINGTPETLHKKIQPAPSTEAPKSYRGWNLNKRGKNKKGEILFNLVKRIGGKKEQKYLGVWNQEKADKIIDEMNQKHS